MTAKTTATRAEAIAAAVARCKGDGFLIYWADHEYVHGVCRTLADTFGTDDPDNARSEIWEEMRIAFDHQNRRAEAERIARGLIFHNGQAPGCSDAYQAATERGETPAADMLELFTAAVLAGMEAAS